MVSVALDSGNCYTDTLTQSVLIQNGMNAQKNIILSKSRELLEYITLAVYGSLPIPKRFLVTGGIRMESRRFPWRRKRSKNT